MTKQALFSYFMPWANKNDQPLHSRRKDMDDDAELRIMKNNLPELVEMLKLSNTLSFGPCDEGTYLEQKLIK